MAVDDISDQANILVVEVWLQYQTHLSSPQRFLDLRKNGFRGSYERREPIKVALAASRASSIQSRSGFRSSVPWDGALSLACHTGFGSAFNVHMGVPERVELKDAPEAHTRGETVSL